MKTIQCAIAALALWRHAGYGRPVACHHKATPPLPPLLSYSVRSRHIATKPLW